MGALLGSAGPVVSGVRWSPTLAVAGSRALWTTFPSGGNTVENGLLTAAPFDPRATGLDLFSVPQSPTGGEFRGGIAGDGPTLVYGKTAEACDEINSLTCHRLDAVGGVSFVTGQYQAGTTFAEALVFFKGKWFLYYGTADSFVGLAISE